MDSTVALNIVLLPDQKIQSQAIVMSRKISEKINTQFILNSTNLIPHITVYQAHYPSKNIKRLMAALLTITKEIKPFNVQPGSFSVEYETYLFWQCIKSKELQNLHDKIVSLANPLRNNLIPPQLSAMNCLTAEDKEEIETYGALLIGPRYFPHITITRLKNPQGAAEALRILGKIKKAKFEAKSLFLGYLGGHGTVNSLIQEFPFCSS